MVAVGVQSSTGTDAHPRGHLAQNQEPGRGVPAIKRMCSAAHKRP